MPRERRFVFLTTAGSSLPTWLRICLIIAAVAAGALLLWFGFMLALAVVVVATFTRLPIRAWKSFKADRHASGPATIEGEYTRDLMPLEAGASIRKTTADDAPPKGQSQ